MKPLSRRFPKHISLDLPEPIRNGMETIADMERHETDEDLVQVVLSRGIVLTLSDAADLNSPTAKDVAQNLTKLKEHGHSLTSGASELSSRATVSPFAAPSVRYKQRRKELGIMTPEEQQAAARNGNGDQEGQSPNAQHLGVPISEELKKRLARFLRSHPELDSQEGIAILLGQGLDHAERDAKARTATDRMTQVAERLYAKAVRRYSA